MKNQVTQDIYTLSRVELTNATYEIIQNFCEDNGLYATPTHDDMSVFAGICKGVKQKEPALSMNHFIMTDLELDVIEGVYEDSKILVCYGTCPPLVEMVKKYNEKIMNSEDYIDAEYDFEIPMIVLDYDFQNDSVDNIQKLQATLKEYCSDSLVFSSNITSVYESEENVMMSLDGIPADGKMVKRKKLRESELLEAEYKGKKVTLNKPFRADDGKHKFFVYVENDKGNVIKLGFGDPDMEIKRDDDERRKSFRARHGCDKDAGPKWKAKYWSCKMWESGKSVTDVLNS